MVEVSYGPLGLSGLRSGKKPGEILSDLLQKDAEREMRQVAIVDTNGDIAVHTGSHCIAEAGHQTGTRIVQGQYDAQKNRPAGYGSCIRKSSAICRAHAGRA
jgi:uncharacterized Ntn-hydrolase superfamily protein